VDLSGRRIPGRTALRENEAALQPVLLTVHDHNPNGATIVLIDGVPRFAAGCPSYQRVVLLFDGEDDAAVAPARTRWIEAKAQGFEAPIGSATKRPLGKEGLSG